MKDDDRVIHDTCGGSMQGDAENITPALSDVTAGKFLELRKIIAGSGEILIAFSGGLDSSVLAAIGHEVLGKMAHCVLVDSEMLPRSELEDAKRIAASLDVPLHIIHLSKLDTPGLAKNPTNRCYHCKKIIAKELKDLAGKLGVNVLADGVNISDFDEHRPGTRAADEAGIIHPFVLAGMGKEEIRDIARHMGLSFADKPSMACLSSRIPYGEEITREKLLRIERAEDFFRENGYRVVRIRHPGSAARIELGREEFAGFMTDPDFREEATAYLRSLGFIYVSLDLEPYRSGSMDAVLES